MHMCAHMRTYFIYNIYSSAVALFHFDSSCMHSLSVHELYRYNMHI